MTEDRVGSWTVADGPLVRRQIPSPTGVLLIGIGMTAAAVALTVAMLTHLEPLPGRLIPFIMLTVIVLAMGAIGVTVIRIHPRTKAARLIIGPEGIDTTHNQVQSWGWWELERVAVEVLLRRNATELAPNALRTRVWINVLLRPTPRAIADRTAAGTLPTAPRWRDLDSVAVYPHSIRITAPMFTSGENLPIVRDIDAALRCYAGGRYVGVQEEKRYTP